MKNDDDNKTGVKDNIQAWEAFPNIWTWIWAMYYKFNNEM